MRFNSTVAGLHTLRSGEVIFFSPLAKSNSKCQSILQKFFVVVQSYHPLVSSFISISLSSAVTSAILSTHSHCLLSLLISIWPIRQIPKWLLLPAHREAAVRCAQAHLLHHNSRHSPNILFFSLPAPPLLLLLLLLHYHSTKLHLTDSYLPVACLTVATVKDPVCTVGLKRVAVIRRSSSSWLTSHSRVISTSR